MLYGSQLVDVRRPRTEDTSVEDIVMPPRTAVKGVSANGVQRPVRIDRGVAIPETLGERIKVALKEAGLTVTEAAERLGVARGAFSTRINAGRVDEEELLKIAAMTRRPPAWLRYGVEGDFEDGVGWTVEQVRAFLATLARRKASPVDDDGNGDHMGLPMDDLGEESGGEEHQGRRRRTRRRG
jgi:transcriptional regulator with XRE-family HTH domain